MDDPEFDIANAFKKPTDRSAALAGRLGSRRPARREEPVQTAQEPEDAPPTPEPPPASREPQRPRAARRRTSPRKAGQGSDGRLVVALPVGLRDRARAHASSRGETYLDVALAAVQDVHDRLPQLIEARQREDEPPAQDGSLFEHRPRRRKPTEGTTQVTIRGLTSHDRDVLETLVDQSGAANLTELITVSLDEHLPQRPRSLR